MLGMAIRVVNPGEPTDTYHWETEQEDFLVLSGEAPLEPARYRDGLLPNGWS
jgi:uncharacterized cupin superfamily protein